MKYQKSSSNKTHNNSPEALVEAIFFTGWLPVGVVVSPQLEVVAVPANLHKKIQSYKQTCSAIVQMQNETFSARFFVMVLMAYPPILVILFHHVNAWMRR